MKGKLVFLIKHQGQQTILQLELVFHRMVGHATGLEDDSTMLLAGELSTLSPWSW